jgi:hypothetical protein
MKNSLPELVKTRRSTVLLLSPKLRLLAWSDLLVWSSMISLSSCSLTLWQLMSTCTPNSRVTDIWSKESLLNGNYQYNWPPILTSSDQLLLIWTFFSFLKTSYLNKEVNRTELSLSERVPWLIASEIFSLVIKNKN